MFTYSMLLLYDLKYHPLENDFVVEHHLVKHNFDEKIGSCNTSTKAYLTK